MTAMMSVRFTLTFVLLFTSGICTGSDRPKVIRRWREQQVLTKDRSPRFFRSHYLSSAQNRQGAGEFNIPSETVVLKDTPQFLEDLTSPRKPTEEESLGTFQRIMNFFGFQNEPDPPRRHKKRHVRRRPQVPGHPFIPGQHSSLVPQYPLPQTDASVPQAQFPLSQVAAGPVSNLEPMIHNSLRTSLPPLSPTAQLVLAQKLRSQLARKRPASFSKVFKSVVYDHYPPAHTQSLKQHGSVGDNSHLGIPSSFVSDASNTQTAQNEVGVGALPHLNKRDAGIASPSTPKNFITPEPLIKEIFSQQTATQKKATDLIIGSLMSFGESAAIVFPEPEPKIVRKKPERALSDTRQAITFPTDLPPAPPHDAVERDFNKSMATGGDKCVLENGQAFHAGDCSLLLTQGACLENHWLVLRQDGTPICAHRGCPWGTLYYKGDCVDPADQSVCGVGQMLYVHLTGEAECDCDPDHYYDPNTNKCYAEHEQAFCKDSFYIELTAENKVECVPNPCHQEGFIKVDDRCYKKEYDGVCPSAQIMFVPETGSAECMQIIPHSIFGVGIQTACPSGSKRGFLGRCRSVFRMPTQRTFPKQRGICPSSFSGGVKNSCRRTIGLFG